MSVTEPEAYLETDKCTYSRNILVLAKCLPLMINFSSFIDFYLFQINAPLKVTVLTVTISYFPMTYT